MDKDKSGDITFDELAFAADEDVFDDFGSAFSGGLGGIGDLGSGLLDGVKDMGGAAMSVVPGAESDKAADADEGAEEGKEEESGMLGGMGSGIGGWG